MSTTNQISPFLNLAAMSPGTETLGPGRRFVVWVQGCPFRCEGCIAPDWIPLKKAHLMPIEYLAQQVIGMEDLAGITISGGEPMLQAGELATWLEIIQAERPELNVIVFSGFRSAQLRWEQAQRLLARTDLLVDGLYVRKKNDGMGLRGSSNQQFHFLTGRLLPFRESIEGARKSLEFQVQPDGVLMGGIPEAGFAW